MKRIILLLLFITFAIQLFSQEKIQKYSKAKIFYSNALDLTNMLNNGIAVDHGSHKKNVFIESVFSETEIKKAKQLGYNVTVEIDDMQKYIVNRNKKASRKINNSTCSSSGKVYNTPANFELGNMGGFYTYTQMLQELDDMHTLYPNLITVKAPIHNFLTFENRPIYTVKISDNPTVDEAEPEILFSAIHHAREPASMQQLIFYMWYLLENYATDTEIAGLINNTEQYFIPVLNVDGYIYNETTNPNGGGFWRKNRRNHNNGNFGVDNNRNYSFHWGEAGVSSDTSGETWAGTAGFSESENQAMKWFCEQHNFIMALNNHTYSGLLLYPFGYANNTPTPEDNLFNSISELMVSKNGYTNQIAADLYPAAGDSDDWMYGDTATHNKIYAMTPEIGYSFWPTQNKIIPICKSMMFHNITAVHLITNYAEVNDATTDIHITQQTGNLDYNIKRIGVQGTGNFTVSIVPISLNIASVGSPQTHNGMTLMQEISNSISYVLENTIESGDEIIYKIVVNNGSFNSEKIITKTFGTPQIIFNDVANTTTNFDNSSWNTTTSSYHSATSSITDSPSGNYSDNQNSTIELSNTIDLTQAITANLSFYAKWNIEAGWDYVQFEISTDNGITWLPQCGKYTKSGVPNQGVDGEPLYDGAQNTWVKEIINLSDYLGNQIKFRFQLVSDGYQTEDGFYFDDVKVEILNNSTVNITDNELLSSNVYPNPINNFVNIEIPNIINSATVTIFSINGKLIKRLKITKVKSVIDLKNINSGIYFVEVKTNQSIKKFKLIKK